MENQSPLTTILDVATATAPNDSELLALAIRRLYFGYIPAGDRRLARSYLRGLLGKERADDVLLTSRNGQEE